MNRLRITNGKAISLGKSRISQQNLKVNKLASIDRTVSVRPGSEGEAGCTDFYDCHWEAWCYFSNDNPLPDYCDEPILVSKVWVYTECPDDDENTPGSIDCTDPTNFANPQCQIVGWEEEDWGTFGTFGYTDENITSTEEESSNDVTHNKFVNAEVSRAGSTAVFRTYEKIVVGRPANIGGLDWTFKSITHLNLLLEGTLVNIQVEPVVIYTDGSLYNEPGTYHYRDSYAKMAYSFKDKRTKVINGQTVTRVGPNDITGVRFWTLPMLGFLNSN